MANNTNNKKRKTWAIVGMLLLGVFLGILLVEFREWMTNMYGAFSLSTEVMCLSFFVGLYLGVYIQAILHEAGHAVFGTLTGYHLVSFRIGKFMWLRQDGKMYLKNFSLAGTIGQCLMEPPEFIDNKIPFVLYNAGGFIVNLISVPILISASVLLFGAHPMLATIFLGLGFMGFILALQNGIPHKTELITNDGYNIYLLKNNPNALRAFWIQLKANAMLARERGYSDMPEEWFVLPPEEEWNNIFQTTLVIMVTGKLSNQGKIAEAREITKKLLQREDAIVGIQRYLLTLECAYYEMIADRHTEEGENSFAEIDSYFAQIPTRYIKMMQKLPSVIRVYYAYAVLQKQDEQAATALLQQFEACARTYPYEVEIAEERKNIERIQQLAAQRKSSQS